MCVYCVPSQVRTLGETVRLDARTKLLNPKWYEGMLGSGYEGVREIQKRLTNTMGWSATSGMVDNWVYDEANSTFIEDDAMAEVREDVAGWGLREGCGMEGKRARGTRAHWLQVKFGTGALEHWNSYL